MRKCALAAMIAFGLTACSSSYRTTEAERNRAASTERRDVSNDRKSFEDRIEARLDKIEREIKGWKEQRAHAKTDRVRRASDRRIDDLEKLKEETRAKYNQMKGGTNENWEKFKADFSQAMDKLEAKWNEFTNDVKRKV